MFEIFQNFVEIAQNTFLGNIQVIHYLILSTLIFCIGIAGSIINYNNIIKLLISLEVMLLGIIINFTAFSVLYNNDVNAKIFILFMLSIAAAEAAIGLSIFVLYSKSQTSNNL